MAIEIQVPLRGDVSRIRPDGIPASDVSERGIETAKFVEIALDLITTPRTAAVNCHALEIDYEAGTCTLYVESEDTTWLAAFEAFVDGKTAADLDDLMKRTRRVGDRYVYAAGNPRDEGSGSRFQLSTDQLAEVKSLRGSAKMTTGSREFLERRAKGRAI